MEHWGEELVSNWEMDDAIEEWDKFAVYDWLQSNVNRKVAMNFVSQDINGKRMLEMTAEEMAELDVTVCTRP